MSAQSGNKIESWGWIQAAIPEIQPCLELQDTVQYQVRLARGGKEVAAACRLRFRVFNLETQSGLESSYLTGMDADEFDAVCDHLVVVHKPSRQIVGTYRMQTGASAGRHIGYYSAKEFDFAPYEGLRREIIELGRACIRRDHRSFKVLTLLWRGIVEYARQRGGRYLIGCSSISSQDPAVGTAVFDRLNSFLIDPPLRTAATPEYAFELQPGCVEEPEVPKLLSAYLSMGAVICGPPALDREFKTIDFLTFFDLDAMSESRRRFLGRSRHTLA
ncbi:MAG TPA: GNAT family N-acyltransferase [Terriglobales bacterium]|jgi:putative hemolysin|nr:GNAT family N-acyltransferase [Terriglobales bacterium]